MGPSIPLIVKYPQQGELVTRFSELAALLERELGDVVLRRLHVGLTADEPAPVNPQLELHQV